MEFQHAMFTRNGVRNLKEIKRGNQSKKAENTEEGGGEQSQRKPAPALAPPLTRTQARDPNPRRGGRAGRRRTAATGEEAPPGLCCVQDGRVALAEKPRGV